MQVLLNDILVDTDKNCIGQGIDTVVIESQSMAVLTFLIKHAGKLVTREMLFNDVWKTKVVTVNSLHRVITILRKSFDDDPALPRFIKTVHGKGYILIAGISQPPKLITTVRSAAVFSLFCLLLIISFSDWFKPTSALSYRNLGNETSLSGIEYLPILAADNSALLFIHQPKFKLTESQLMLKMLASQKLMTLHHFSGKVNALAWSDDKTQIAIAIQVGERCQVYNFMLDGNNITENAPPLFQCVPHSPIKLAWSINGKSLFVLKSLSGQQLEAQLFNFDMLLGEISMVKTTLPEIHGFERAPNSDALILFSNISSVQSQVWLLPPYQLEKQEQQAKEIVDIPHLITKINSLSSPDNWLVLADDKLYLLNLNGDFEAIKDSSRLGIIDMNVADNDKIFFSSHLSRYDVQELDLRLNNAAMPFQPSSKNQAAASYSPDGKQSVFLSDRNGQGWQLWFNDEETNRVVPTLAHPLALATPQWSPDGKSVIVLSEYYQLLAVDLETSEVTALTDSQEVVLAGTWADNKSIYYSRAINEQFEIFQLNITTKQEKQITFKGGYFSQLSDDQKFLFFNKRNQSGLWRLQLSNGQVQLALKDFGADNYSRWQLVDETIFFRHHSIHGSGMFKYDLERKVQPILKDSNIWLFNVKKDQSKVLISNQGIAYADIKSGALILR